MAYQDSDAERRNLVVTSLGFILYYLAGGSIPDGDLKFQIVNLHFEHPEYLGCFAWVMLFWFALRYWQTHRDINKNSFFSYRSDISALSHNSFLIKKYIFHKEGLEFEPKGRPSVVDCRIVFEDKQWYIQYDTGAAVYEGADDEFKTIYPKSVNNNLPMSLFYGRGIKNTYLLLAIITKPSYLAYTAPYLFFWLAILIPLIQNLDARITSLFQ